MIINLPDKLREVTGLHTFAELFGFNWNDDSDWYWCDVADRMALEVEEYYRHGYEDGLHANTEAAFEAAKQAFERTCHDTGVRYPGWTCSECDSEQMYAPCFCPDCGARVTDRTELLPCPFCGSEAAVEEYDYYDDGPDYNVQCTNIACACSGPYCFWRTKEEAVKAWNTRHERTCHDIREFGDFTCSVCGCVVRDTADENPTTLLNGRYVGVKYCPHCGRKVEK